MIRDYLRRAHLPASKTSLFSGRPNRRECMANQPATGFWHDLFACQTSRTQLSITVLSSIPYNPQSRNFRS
jgi:hypothetical protein